MCVCVGRAGWSKSWEKITMSVEEKYEDVLQNLESAPVGYYRENPELIDAEVETAISWLVKLYSAEAQGKTSGEVFVRGKNVHRLVVT